MRRFFSTRLSDPKHFLDRFKLFHCRAGSEGTIRLESGVVGNVDRMGDMPLPELLVGADVDHKPPGASSLAFLVAAAAALEQEGAVGGGQVLPLPRDEGIRDE